MNTIKKILLINIAFLIYALAGVVAKINGLITVPFSSKFFVIFIVQSAIIAIYSIIWQFTIKWIDLTIAFAFKGITIVWGMIFAVVLFNESITYNNILGAIVIIIGVMVVAREHE